MHTSTSLSPTSCSDAETRGDSGLPAVALIAGPTASGKSAIALALAERTGGVIINADASQIYTDLSVLSACPTAEERARAPHRLFGVIDGAQACSAAHWATLARGEIKAAIEAGRLPIVVGGTGLYIRTLLDGIAPVPDIDADIRAAVRAAPVADNFAALIQEDPDAAARLAPADTARVARALEVIRSTGHPIGWWRQRKEGGIGDHIALRPLVLLPPRDWLYTRCDARFEAMMKGGAVEEVEALLARDLSPDLPVMRAIGVPEISAILRLNLSVDEGIAQGQLATRQYAKRQYTWFSRQPPTQWTRWTAPLSDNMNDIIEIILQ